MPNIERFIEEVRRISMIWLTEDEKTELFEIAITDRVLFLDLLYMGVSFKSCHGCINNIRANGVTEVMEYKEILSLYYTISLGVFTNAAPRILFIN